jgi:RNA polymerase sigma-70 factor (ECF subfamily)
MTSASVGTTAPEPALFEAAREGDENAFAQLVEPRRGELHAHCYRMLGSLHDAEDALQEAMIRAWRSLSKVEDRTALRAWLYRIATNTCLDAIGKRPKRVLPIDYGPATDPHAGPGEPLVESVWVEPYPDEILEVEDGYAAPEATYEQREAVELAFIAALQFLPAQQRAVLVLREVLGFSAKEVAETLDTTVAGVNSALQRARKTVEERTPDQSQQETARSLGDEGLRAVVEGYVDAWQSGDVDAVVAKLTEDVAFAMPPLASWFSGHEGLRTFLAGWPLSGNWRWQVVETRANGQPALAFYTWDDDAGKYLPFALNVLTLRGDLISDVTAFVTRSIAPTERSEYARWPDQPADADRLAAFFQSFRLPPHLDREE